MKFVPLSGSPPMPTQVVAEAEQRGLPDSLVSQRTGARDDAHPAAFVDIARHDADLALSRRDNSWAVGADEPAFFAISHHAADLDHIANGNALSDTDDKWNACIFSF
jgi:hypothetical protein